MSTPKASLLVLHRGVAAELGSGELTAKVHHRHVMAKMGAVASRLVSDRRALDILAAKKH